MSRPGRTFYLLPIPVLHVPVPSRSHPILDAAYDIPVDEAALTVDMRVPYQQLKPHVAAGPLGMRNEYLRCLVGEYAPASGPAAVRAMSEVASMYLQVGEAERRALERAVVDNMKEAYVSVLAPSRLGIGISAGDSMLIHGVRLIAEKLGPLAVIVHTDLHNASNEAWRRTIIQRHIDCSSLHHVIHAFLASLSTDLQLDAASAMWTVPIPTARTVMTPHELREVAAGYFFLPSPCLAPVVGSQIILPSTEHNPVTVDLYGDALMNLSAHHGDAHWRVQHDAIADGLP
eukprot:jgi/Tetstr1/439017/TSEL_027509.t1